MKVRLSLGSELGKLRDPTGGPGAYVRGLGSGLWLNKKMKMMFLKKNNKKSLKNKASQKLFQKIRIKKMLFNTRIFLIRNIVLIRISNFKIDISYSMVFWYNKKGRNFQLMACRL